MSKLKEIKKVSESSQDYGPVYTIAGILIAVLAFAAIYFSFFNGSSGIGLVSLEGGGHSRGNPDAKVRVVEFSDFQCPACEYGYLNWEQLFSEYGDRVKFTYRHFPLINSHPFAQKAAEASECAAEQGKFWEMYSLLFENQDKLTNADLKGYSASLSLDQNQFDSCLDSGKYSEKVASDLSYSLSIGLNSTPTFFVNGEKYSNISIEQWRSILDQKLA